MALQTCAGCSTRYAPGLDACPHCGSAERDGEVGAGRRLPLFMSVSCECNRSWNLRLNTVQSGLVELPALFCTSCGSQVRIPWPPVEDSMPKITKEGGPTNARDGGPSPDAPASTPPVGAEADRGHSSDDEYATGGLVSVGESGPENVSMDSVQNETDQEQDVDRYAGMTLVELRAEADKRKVPSYGTKAQIAERLREDDEQES